MPDLFISEPEELRTKRRAFRISIENVKGPDKVITYHQEDEQVDANDVTKSSKRAPDISVPFSHLIGELREIADPVTGNTVIISGAAIAMWIEADYFERASALLGD